MPRTKETKECYSKLLDHDGYSYSDDSESFCESLELIEQCDHDVKSLSDESSETETSYSETLVNFIKGLLGTGIFSLPAAFAKAGLFGGTLGLIFLSYLSSYTAYILIKTQVEVARRKCSPSLNFQETAEAVLQDGPQMFKKFSSFANSLVKFLINLLSFGSACVYNIVIASNFKQIVDPLFGVYDLNYYMIFMLPLLLPLNLVRSLKYIAPISCLSNFVMLFIVSSILWYFFQGKMHSFSERSAFGNVYLWPQFAGVIFFANSCITLVLPLKNEMKEPDMFEKIPTGVLMVGNVSITLIYWVFGFFGYLKYGDSVYESVTLNLPLNDIIVILIQVGVALATLAMTPLNFYVLFDILDNDIIRTSNPSLRTSLEYALRIVVVLLSVLLSMLVPNISLLISLMTVGANCFLTLFLPSFLYLITFGLKLSMISISFNLLIMMLSIVLFVFGTIYQVQTMFAFNGARK